MLRLRRRVGARARQEFGPEGSREVYVASLSSRTVVYKGMVRSEVLAQYYADLRDSRFAVSFAVYHRRFSTNTLPRWPLAQPMRLLGHNGAGKSTTIAALIEYMCATQLEAVQRERDRAEFLLDETARDAAAEGEPTAELLEMKRRKTAVDFQLLEAEKHRAVLEGRLLDADQEVPWVL